MVYLSPTDRPRFEAEIIEAGYTCRFKPASIRLVDLQREAELARQTPGPSAQSAFAAAVGRHPLMERDTEAALRALDQRRRKRTVWNGCEFALALVQEFVRRERRDRANHVEIGERRPNLDRVRHPGPIGVAQQLIPHVASHLERSDLEKRSIDPFDRAAKRIFGVERRKSVANGFRIENLRDFPRHEQGAPQKVSTRVAACIFEHRGVFRRGHPPDNRCEPLAERAAGWARKDSAPSSGDRRDLAEAAVTTEQLVAANPRKRRLKSELVGRIGDEIGIDTIGRRLVHRGNDALEMQLEFIAPEPSRVMLSRVAICDYCGERCLVLARTAVFVESQRDGAELRVAGLRGERRYCRRI